MIRDCDNCKHNFTNSNTSCYDRWYEMNEAEYKTNEELEDLLNCWESK